jgi:hypothetical protein
MSIPETISFDKEGEALSRGPSREVFRRFFLVLVIILVGLLSFGIGRLTSTPTGEGVKIEYDPQMTNAQLPMASQVSAAATPLGHSTLDTGNSAASSVVASKSGSKYHYPSCPGAKQIKEANKITFPSAQAAEGAGYTLAANCKRP